jgi:hypothetical protein
MRQTFREVGANLYWAGECASIGMACRRLICEFHDDRAHRSIDICGVLLAPEKVLVRLEGSSRSCCGHDGYSERLPMLGGGMSWDSRIVGRRIGAKAWNRDDPAAAANGDTWDWRSARRRVAGAARARSWRGSPSGSCVGAESGTGFCGAGAGAIHAAARAIASTNAGASSGAAEARLLSTRRRHGKRSCAADDGQPNFGAGLGRHHSGGVGCPTTAGGRG